MTVPVTKEPSAGAVSEPVGLVRSIVMSTRSEPVMPASSVATARRARLPSASIVHRAEYGALASTPSETHEPVEQPVLAFEQRKSSMAATSPSGVVAVTLKGSAAAPLTKPVGAVIVTVGSVLSTVTVRVAEVKVFPAASVVMTRRS